MINGRALRIIGVQPLDASEITCTATNLAGKAVASSELTIKGRTGCEGLGIVYNLLILMVSE